MFFDFKNHPHKLLLTDILLGACALFSLVAVTLSLFALAVQPFELEMLEGAFLDTLFELRQGRSLYPPPNAEFIPFMYTPLYHWLAGAFSFVFGLSFLSLRLVSVLASIGVFIAVAVFMKKDTDSLRACWAAGLFAAAYALGGQWMALARVDALFWLLLMLSILSLYRATSMRGLALAGLLAALAFFTKQSALAYLVGASAWALLIHRRAGLAFVLAAFLPVITGVLALDMLTGGWFSYYVFEAGLDHPMHWNRLPQIAFSELLIPWLPAIVLFAYTLRALMREKQWRTLSFWLLAGGAIAGMSLIARLKDGGHVNSFIPLFMLLSIGFGLGAARLYALANARRAWAGVLIVLGVWQFGMLHATNRSWWVDSRLAVAESRDVCLSAEAFMDRVRALPQPVFCPSQSYLTRLAGQPLGSANTVALVDILQGRTPDERERVLKRFRESFLSMDYRSLILDTAIDPTMVNALGPEIQAMYEPVDTDWGIDGLYTARKQVFIRKGEQAPPRTLPIPTRCGMNP